MHKYCIVFLSLLFPGIFLFGQDIALLTTPGTIQSNYINPADFPKKKFQISLAGIHGEIFSRGPSYGQITRLQGSTRYLDFDNWASNVKSLNGIFVQGNVHTFDVSMKVGKWAFSGGHAFRQLGELTYSGKLLELLSSGNAPFIGQTLSIGPSMQYNAWNEFYIGVQRKFGRLSIGLKLKYMAGLSSLATESNGFKLTTKSEFYQWQFDTDYVIRSSSAFRFNSFDDVVFQPTGLKLSFDHLLYNNTGFGADLGLSYTINDRLGFFASAVDLGSIKWDFVPRKYESKGSFLFDGFDIEDILIDSAGISVSDSLYQIFNFKESREQFTTNLPTKFYAGVHWKFMEKYTFNFLFRSDFNWQMNTNYFYLSGVRNFKKADLGLSWNVRNGSYINPGIIVRLHFGPFGWYAYTDNILGLVDSKSQQIFNLRSGLHFQF